MSDPIPNPNLHPRRNFLKAATLGLGTSAIAATAKARALNKADSGTSATSSQSIGISGGAPIEESGPKST